MLHPHVTSGVVQGLRREESPDRLTPRELDVLGRIARGQRNREIASNLHLSEETVKTHVSNLLSKLHVADRTQAAVYALRIGLVPLENTDDALSHGGLE